MANIKASITYFDLKQFGFYRLRKGAEPEFIDGDIPSVTTSLKGWLEGKQLRNTIPWDATTNQRRTRVYCRSYAVDDDTGDIVLVLWKSVGDSSGNVHGAYARSNVGSDTHDDLTSGSDAAGEEVIWGQPCYYWIIPEKNKVASIRLAGSVEDIDSLNHYIKAFVDYRGDFPNKKSSDRTIHHAKLGRDIKINSFTFEYRDEKDRVYHASFKMKTELFKKASSTLNYEALAQDVTHIVYRDTISASVDDSRPAWVKVFDKVGSAIGYQAPATQGERQIEVIVDAKPNARELTELVERYAVDHDEQSGWNNIGLRVGGRGESTTWLDEFVLKDELIIGQEGTEAYTAEQILTSINAQRTRLIDKIGSTVTVQVAVSEESETDEQRQVAEA